MPLSGGNLVLGPHESSISVAVTVIGFQLLGVGNELPVLRRSENSESLPSGLVRLGTLIIFRLIRDS
jgi:hypothetical protein